MGLIIESVRPQGALTCPLNSMGVGGVAGGKSLVRQTSYINLYIVYETQLIYLARDFIYSS